MPQRNPEETLKILEDQALEDEIRDVAAMSEKDLDGAMRAAGIDPTAAHAAGRAFSVRARSASAQQPPDGGAWVSGPPPAPRRSLGARWTVIVAATLTAAVVAATMYAAGQFGQRDAKIIDVVLDGSSTASTKASAERLRAGALDACKRGHWQECIDGLATARTLDPAGDAEPRVQEAWRAARDGLERQGQSGPTSPDSKQRLPTGPDKK